MQKLHDLRECTIGMLNGQMPMRAVGHKSDPRQRFDNKPSQMLIWVCQDSKLSTYPTTSC